MEGLQVQKQKYPATKDLEGQESSLLSQVWQAGP